MIVLKKWYHKLFGSRYISIREKILGSVMIIIVVLGGINFYISLHYTQNATRHDIESKATLTCSILQKELARLLLVRDLAELNDFINSIKIDNPDILYIVVFDDKKQIVGHTFSDTRIPSFITENAFGPSPSLFRDRKHRLYIRQYIEKISSGRQGVALVGMDDGVLNHEVRKLSLLFWTTNIIFYIFSGVFIFLVSSILIRPLKRLMAEFIQYVPGKPVSQEIVRAHDEIRLLHEGFKDMVQRLNAMYTAQEETQLKIIETEKQASIGVLASGVAHEINNPIAGIEACAFRLQKSEGITPKQREYIDLIVESARHIHTITYSLLQYARQPGLVEEEIDLRNIVRFSIKLLQYRLDKNRLQIVTEFPDFPCMVSGITVNLVQVVINGILNAIDVSSPGGAITIDIKEKAQNYQLSISDQGAGVDPNIRDRVFDPFTTTKGRKGTGLGLYVSYNIVRAHNGSINLTSLPGQGATLTVELPMLAPETFNSAKTVFFGEGI